MSPGPDSIPEPCPHSWQPSCTLQWWPVADPMDLTPPDARPQFFTGAPGYGDYEDGPAVGPSLPAAAPDGGGFDIAPAPCAPD